MFFNLSLLKITAMNKGTFFMLLLLMPFYIQAQELMTIGEVFDFETGDEFHQHSTLPQAMANADRITITDKYFSANSDTVFYVMHHRSYWSEVSWDGGEPHMIYHYGSRTDTTFYTNLSAPISVYDEGFLLNQQSYTNSQFCDSLINACTYEVGPGFENDTYSRKYGKGLGLVSSFHSTGMNGAGTILNDKVFYYKKNGLACGSPDLTGVGVQNIVAKESDFTLFPNPAQSIIHLINKGTSKPFEYSLMDGTGRFISTGAYSAVENTLTIEHLKPGIYFILIRFDNKVTTLKVVKE